ncbi:MAG: hypothetical protein ACYC63_08605 [Armatimonadota bacterium]
MSTVGNSPPVHIEIRLGAVTVPSEALLSCEQHMRSEPRTESFSTIVIKAESPQVAQLDYAEQLWMSITLEDGKVHERSLGWVTSAVPSEDGQSVTVSAYDMEKLSEGKAAGCAWQLTVPEIFEFMAQQLHVPYDIEGLDPEEPEHIYVVIMPVHGIAIKEVPMDVFQVRFYRPADGDLEERVLSSAPQEYVRNEWSPDITRCKTFVQGRTAHDAIVTGRTKIQRAIDWLSVRSSATIGGLVADGRVRPLRYRRSALWPRISLSGWAYARDTDERTRCKALAWYVDSPLGPSDLPLDPDDGYWGDMLPLLSQYADLPRETLNSHERSILDAMHFLGRAHRESDVIDAFLDLWTALELLLAHETHASALTKQDLRRLRKVLRELHHDDQEGPIAWLTDGQLDRGLEALQMASNLPLRRQYAAFLAAYGVSVCDGDTAFLWDELRRKRNDIIHGTFAAIGDQDVNRMRAIVQRMLFAKASRFALTKSRLPW